MNTSSSDTPVLACLSYAGGTAALFRRWADRLGDIAEIRAIDLPGRGELRGADALKTMQEAAEYVTAAVDDIGDRPLAWFGHSMGAIVAYEAAHSLARSRDVSPLWFFASGCAAPHLFWQRVPPQGDEELVETAVRWARHDDRPSPEAIRPNLTHLRADMALCESYRWSPRRRMNAPVTAFCGTLDEVAPQPEVQAWVRTTSRSLVLQLAPGGHFFIRTPEGADFVCRVVRQDLERALSRRRRRPSLVGVP